MNFTFYIGLAQRNNFSSITNKETYKKKEDKEHNKTLLIPTSFSIVVIEIIYLIKSLKF